MKTLMLFLILLLLTKFGISNDGKQRLAQSFDDTIRSGFCNGVQFIENKAVRFYFDSLTYTRIGDLIMNNFFSNNDKVLLEVVNCKAIFSQGNIREGLDSVEFNDPICGSPKVNAHITIRGFRIEDGIKVVHLAFYYCNAFVQILNYRITYQISDKKVYTVISFESLGKDL
ncbi:MAG TPA: hypothetical protein VIZ28_17020 [Chitinophagaceae bacterium]